MAYMEEQALERERLRQQMLAGQDPSAIGQADPNAPTPPPAVQLPTSSDDILSAVQQFLSQALTPKGVKVDQQKDLEVPMMLPSRPPPATPERWKGSDVDVGGAISGMFDKAQGSALQQMLRKQQEAQRGASTRDAASRGGANRPYVPPTAEQQTERAQGLIPGLKPAIDATKAPPGAPSAEAYVTEKTPGPGVTGVEKGVGAKADLDFLSERGGHATQMIDGKKTNVPIDTPGAYGQLHPELAARLVRAAKAYEAETGKKATFGEFSRGEDVQKTYWEDSAHGTKYAAAPPGRSHHQSGTAGDIPPGEFQDWLHKNGDAHGVHFPVKNDAPHVEMNPKFTEKLASQAPAVQVPPWDKGLPAQPDPQTKWDAPAGAVPEPAAGSRGVSSTAQPGNVLSEQRAGVAKYFDSNPTAKDSMAAVMLAEAGDNSIDRTGVVEAGANRIVAANRPVTDILDPAYYQPMHDGSGNYEKALKRVQSDPQLRAQLHAEIDAAVKGGSNHTKLATDFASGNTAANSASNSTTTVTMPNGGNSYFRKDQRPDVHGADTVRNVQDWHTKTDSALKGGGGGGTAPAAGAPATVEKPPVPAAETALQTMRNREPATAAAPPASVFDKGTAAVPVSGAGGLQAGEDVPATTGAALYPDADTAAVNAIKPPTAATVASAAPAVTPAPAAVPPPAPAAAPPPARPAAPPPASASVSPKQSAPVAQTGLDRAHAILDMKAGDFVKKYAPEHLGKVQSFGYADTPMRDIIKKPFVGSQVTEGLAPHMKELGFSMQDYQKALTQPSPLGKRSEGTSDATDFSARARTPMAPPGLERGVVEDRRAEPPVESQGLLERGMNKVQDVADNVARKYGTPPAPDELSTAAGAKDLARSIENRTPISLKESWPPSRYEPPTIDVASQPAVQNADGTISTIRTIGVNEDGREVNIPTVPAEGGRIMSDEEAIQRYKETGRHLGKYESIDKANVAADRMHNEDAMAISQHPQGVQQPQITPSLAEALVDSVKDQGRPPIDMKPNPEAMPVLPATGVAPAAPGAPGGPLSLAPAGLTAPGGGPFQTAMGAPGSQGGAIATLGMLPPIQNSTFSTPLLDQQAAQPSVGYGNLSPIPWDTVGSWGWGGGPSAGIGDFGGGGGGGGAASMFSGSGGLFPTPMTWGG